MILRGLGALLCAFALSVVAEPAQPARTSSPVLSINAAKGEIRIVEEGIHLRLPAVRSVATQRTSLQVDWLDEEDRVLSQATESWAADGKPGRVFDLTLPSPFAQMEAEHHEQALWHRLRCRLVSSQGKTLATQIVSVSQLPSNLFRSTVLVNAHPGRPKDFTFLLRAIQPLRGEPIAAVRFRVFLSSEKKPSAEGISDSSGTFRCDITLPDKVLEEGGSSVALLVEAQLFDYHQSGESSIRRNTESSFLLQTDKGIYQPGQLMQIRSAAFSPTGKTWTNALVRISVDDPNRREVLKLLRRTNRFGVVAADWRIPADAQSGLYGVEVALEDLDGESRPGTATQQVKVLRYELPQFTVAARSTKPWYSYDQSVDVNVEAKYFHGKPLPKGKVTLRELDVSYWDEKLKKTVLVVPQVITADLSQGTAQLRFTPTVPPPHSRAARSERSVEIEVASEAGQKETFRTRITLSEQPILFELRGKGRLSSRLPGTLYLRTTDPVGQPVSASVRLRLSGPGSRPRSFAVKTDGQGYGRVDGIQLPHLPRADDEWMLAAFTEEAGQTSIAHWFGQAGNSSVRIALDRHHIKAGEPIHVELKSVAEAQSFDLAVRSGEEVVAVETVRTENHRATLVIPTSSDWAGGEYQVQVQRQIRSAMDVEDDGFESADDAEPVYVDSHPLLSIAASTDRGEYRPGTKAVGQVEVRDVNGQPVAAAVGVAVVDEALVQREKERMGPWWRDSWAQTNDYPEGPPDSDRPTSLSVDERWLVWMLEDVKVDALLFNATFNWNSSHSYSERAKKDLEPARKALIEWNSPQHDLPVTLAGLEQLAVRLHTPLRPVDPWGHPYVPRVHRTGEWMKLKVASAGPDGRFHTFDDIDLDLLAWRWFNPRARALSQILASAVPFPTSLDQLRSLLARRKQSSLLQLPSGWLETKTGMGVSRTFAATIITFDELQRRQAAGEPVNNPPKLANAPWLELWDVERDTKEPWSSPKRYLLARLQGPPPDVAAEEQLRRVAAARPMRSSSGIRGEVNDTLGYPLAKAMVTLSRGGTPPVLRLETDGSGLFRANLVPGDWDVHVEAPGFQSFTALQVPVAQGLYTRIRLELQIGSVSEEVEVSAETPTLQTAVSSMVMRKSPLAPPPPTSTPDIRVREDFPETLLWAPLLETDAQGRVQIPFSLADSITSWRFRAVASTEDGRIGFAKTKFTTTQPLFLTYVPPERLTVGDEITVPFSVHNYLPHAQKLSLSADASSGLEVQHAPSASLQVDAGAEQPVDVRLKATQVSSSAVSKLVARGDAESDAIARKVRVEALGRPLQTVTNQLLQSNLSLSIEGRPGAIDQARRVELQIYPDLLSHVFAASDALLLRPIGCSEQIISSAYPNLFTLQRLAQDASPEAELLRKRAKDNLEIGYERLLNRQTAKGGFSFFDGGEPSAPLTAYAIRFLRDLETVFPVDPDVGKQAAQWLVQSQEDLGQWRTGSLREDSAMIIAALSGEKEPPRNAIRRATEWLERDSRRDSPLVLATLLRAALRRGDMDAARDFHSRLLGGTPESSFSSASIEERSELRAMFSQRGRAVSVEGAAAIAAALTEAEAAGLPPHRDLVAAAINAILRLKDERQTWYTTHATVSALEGLMVVSNRSAAKATDADLKLTVNGKVVPVPAPASPGRPIVVDLSSWAGRDPSRVEVSSPASTLGMVSVTDSFFEPWTDARSTRTGRHLDVSYSAAKVELGDVIQVHVRATDHDPAGWSMPMVEVGLPPGAVVDEESLEAAQRMKGSRIGRYEVEPSKVTFYLWSSNDPIEFQFAFRPRYAMKARSTMSRLWSYYDPEDEAVVAPVLFEVTGPKAPQDSGAIRAAVKE